MADVLPNPTVQVNSIIYASLLFAPSRIAIFAIPFEWDSFSKVSNDAGDTENVMEIYVYWWGPGCPTPVGTRHMMRLKKFMND